MSERMAVLDAIEEVGGIHTIADLARRWGVSRAAAHELSQNEDFPAPLLYIGKSPVYAGHEVDRWRAERGLTVP